jgi:hypothetical protein
MSNGSDAGFDHARYRKLLAQANDETKRLALINLLIEERAQDKLARHSLHDTLVRMGIVTNQTADSLKRTA